MAGNTNPRFTLNDIITWGKVTGVDGSMDGTDADVVLVATGGTNGSYIQKLILQPISTSGSTTTSTAAARIYLNNGSTVGTGTNNVLCRELQLPATAVNVASTSASIGVECPIGFSLPASYRLYVGVTAMAANTQWNVVAISGDY